jgi:hypothetical protein
LIVNREDGKAEIAAMTPMTVFFFFFFFFSPCSHHRLLSPSFLNTSRAAAISAPAVRTWSMTVWSSGQAGGAPAAAASAAGARASIALKRIYYMKKWIAWNFSGMKKTIFVEK